jgi:hypothetical protein
LPWVAEREGDTCTVLEVRRALDEIDFLRAITQLHEEEPDAPTT